MATPLFCDKCGDIVGMEKPSADDILARLTDGSFRSAAVILDCPGKSKHPKAKRTERKRLFGLINQVMLSYPETRTQSSWAEYVGPAKKFWLRFAIIFGTSSLQMSPRKFFGVRVRCDGLVVNGEWAWYDPKIGLFGDGVEELKKLRVA